MTLASLREPALKFIAAWTDGAPDPLVRAQSALAEASLALPPEVLPERVIACFAIAGSPDVGRDARLSYLLYACKFIVTWCMVRNVLKFEEVPHGLRANF